jgi:tetratricopeptide (TPR) repeat protein
MKTHEHFYYCVPWYAALAMTLMLASCATSLGEQSADNLPMYGQPAISRPDTLKKADDEFIRQAAASIGSREAASKAWNTQAEEFMRKGDLNYAMRRYNQSWLLNPDNYQPYWGFGRVVLERDQLDEAILYFEKAKKLINDPYQKVALLTDTGIAYSFKAASLSTDNANDRAHYFRLANQNLWRAQISTLDTGTLGSAGIIPCFTKASMQRHGRRSKRQDHWG